MRYILVLLGLMFAGVANAIDCEKVPDCESLGYSTESEPNCAENGYLNCPFDETYKLCVNYDCAALGFTDSDKSSWCADLIECRGNRKMTLCQKACIATKYEDLKELAETGKCNLITMKNDITIPQNENITFAPNTIIDGGGHTLHTSVSKENVKNFILRDQTGFRNINFEHKAVDMQSGNSIIWAEKVETPISFSNVHFHVTSDVDTIEKTSSSTIIVNGKSAISGQFEIIVKAKYYYTPFADGEKNFTNADVLINVDSFNHALFVRNDVSFENSKAQLITTNTPFANTKGVNIKNSDVSVNPKYSLFYSDNISVPGKINLLENGRLTYKMGDVGSFIGANYANFQFYLKGTAQNPASLILDVKKEKENTADIISSANTTDTVVLNGVTYRPTKAGTTKLSEIETSADWQKQN